jgi:hypothetical protein
LKAALSLDPTGLQAVFGGFVHGTGIALKYRCRDFFESCVFFKNGIQKGGVKMNKRSFFWVGIAAAIILAMGAAIQASAEENSYLMTGEITAIDMSFDTVVIEAPLGADSFTVGGPLSPDARVIKNGRSADLSDFTVGDKVSVVWRATASGHVIEKIECK